MHPDEAGTAPDRPAECHGAKPRQEASALRGVAEALVQAASGRPGHGVTVVGHPPRSYPELLGEARVLLAGLLDAGCRPGQVVVLFGLELTDFFPAFWACLLGGLVPLPIFDRRDAPAGSADRLAGACELLDDPLILTGAGGTAGLAHDDRFPVLDIATCRGRGVVDGTFQPDGPETALMLLSSGSTGRPKIIPLTHEGILDFAAGSRQVLGWTHEDSTLNWLPLDASAALLLFHVLPVFVGADNVHMPGEQVVAEPTRWFDLVSEHQVRHTWAPTFGYRMVSAALQHAEPRDWDLSGVRSLICGGEQIVPSVVDGFLAAMAPYGLATDCFVPAWGMTETVTGITWGRYRAPGSLHRVRTASLRGRVIHVGEETPDDECTTLVAAGGPAPGAAVRIVDDGQRVLTEGTVGRLQVRSVRNTPGYLGDDAADTRTFVAADDGGRPWLDTGDLAFIQDGQIVMVGRAKDVVIINGENHPCHPIEAVVESVDGVAAGFAAACGVPDEAAGSEVLALFFAPEQGGRPPADIARDIGRTVSRRLGLFPRHVLPVPAGDFPRTPNGKIRRDELVRMLPGPPASRERPEAPGTHHDRERGVRALLRREIAALCGTTPDELAGADDTPFFELGLTSVLLARLRGRIGQELGVDLSTVLFFEHPSIAELASHLRESGLTPPVPEPAGSEASPGRPAEQSRAAGPGTMAGRGPAAADMPIAIIGMSLRFPGATTPEQFWDDLVNGRNRVTVFDPRTRQGDPPAGSGPESRRGPWDRSAGGVLAEVDAFDAAFFGMHPREAALTHPGHRLFLECAYLALESAGYARHADGVRIGVYAGEGANLRDYQTGGTRPGGLDLADSMLATFGAEPDFLASRVAYRLGLTGPAVGVRTACSTSLVAVHLAVQALRGGDADLALVGAASVALPQDAGYVHHPESVLSATGVCRPFDAEADGTVGGNGVAAVLLKPLAAALADEDPILAVIAGTAINNDGARKVGYTAPSVEGQAEVVRTALRRAGVRGADLSYVEAHGTGTPVGDPVEFRALSRALGDDPEPRVPGGDAEPSGRCALGSVKAGIGHLDACAGMAGLIKVVLMLRHRRLVPTVNLRRPSPELDLAGGPLELVTESRPMPARSADSSRYAGVNALGVGGTNAFVVLREAPRSAADARADAGETTGNQGDRGERTGEVPVLVPISGHDRAAVRELALRLADHLTSHPDTRPADVVATMAARPAYAERTAVTGSSSAELADRLNRLARGGGETATAGTGERTSTVGSGTGDGGSPATSGSRNEAAAAVSRTKRDTDRRPAFAYTGQGSAYRGMARELYAAFPAMREVLDECDRVHREATGDGLLDVLLDRAEQAEALPTALAQPAQFALQSALTEQWLAWGVVPDRVLGHSMGEIAALYAAGALSLADGVRLTSRRGRLMESGMAAGGMLAVRADIAMAERVGRESGLEIAARNGANGFVLAGTEHAVRMAEELLERYGMAWRRVRVSRAFHTGMLDPVVEPLAELAAGCTLLPLRVPFIRGVDGAEVPAGTVVPHEYLVAQARRPVRFDLALATLDASGCDRVIELGPDAELVRLGRRALTGLAWTATQRADADAGQAETALLALAELYRAGHEVAWDSVARGGRRVPLPGYPFKRTTLPPYGAGHRHEPITGRPETVDGEQGPIGDEHESIGDQSEETGVTSEFLEAVRDLTARRFRLAREAVDVDATFTAMGGDSLSLVGLTRQIERDYDMRIPIRDLFAEADTPRKLARAIAAARPQPPALPRARPSTETVTARPARPPAGGFTAGERPAPASGAPDPAGGIGRAAPVTAAPDVPDGPDGSLMSGAVQGMAAPSELSVLCAAQLEAINKVTDLMGRQLDAMTAATARPDPTADRPAPARGSAARTGAGSGAAPIGGSREGTARSAVTPVAPQPVAPPSVDPPADGPPPAGCDYSLYFFGDYPDQDLTDKYAHILAAAEFADQHGLHSLWLPERHFASFGGIFPNPSVLAAALATRTSRIRLNAGSVVLPLHEPIRVAEEWSVVDNLSGGRVGLCVASGWHANDFVLAPGNYGGRRDLMYRGLDTVRRLWAGERVRATSGTGSDVEVSLFPRPVQERPPMFVAVVGNPDSYRTAAENDLGIVTNLMSQSIADLAANIALYRRTRAACGLDPAAGRVVVLMHTYLGTDLATAREEASRPFRDYLRSSLPLLDGLARSLGLDADLDGTDPEDLDFLLERAYERYCADRALIGTPDSCRPIADAVVAAGADEIACFVDFGVAHDRMLAALPLVPVLRDLRPADGGVRPEAGRPPAPSGDIDSRSRAGTSAALRRTGPAVPPGRPYGTRAEPPPVHPGDTDVAATAAPAGPPREAVAASAAQQRLWLVEQMYPGRRDYYEPKAIVLRGRLDPPAFQGALDRVVARHSQLRSVFAETDGTLWRIVRPPKAVACPTVDMRHRSVDEAIAELTRSTADTVLDLADGPLFSLRLARLGEDLHVLFLVAHHIIFDSLSTQVFCRDLVAAYDAWPGEPESLPELPDEPRADPAVAARRGERSLEFWIEELAGAPVLVLPPDRPGRQATGRSLVHDLDGGLGREVAGLARECGATPFMVLLAGLASVLGRMSGQDDFMLGTAMTNRPDGTEDRIGMYIDTVVIRLDLSGDPSFEDLVGRVRDRTLRAYDHQDAAFDEVVSALNPERVPGGNPLFGVMVEYENHAATDLGSAGLDVRSVDVPSERAPFDLTFYLTREPDGVRCVVEYNAGMFEEATVHRILGYLENVLRRATTMASAPLSRLTELTAEDAALLQSWQGAVTEDSTECLHHLVERQARRTPDAPALIDDTTTLSYAELDGAADRLAGELRERGVGRGQVVGLCLAPGHGLIVAMLAVLKTGAAYLPLDVSLPEPRLAYCLTDSGASLLLVDAGSAGAHPALSEWPTHVVATEPDADPSPAARTRPSGGAGPAEDAGPAELSTAAEAEAEPGAQTEVGPEDPAYLIYTSGSSGSPKGVLVPHRGPVNLVRWQLRAHPPLRTLQWTSAGFDVSVQEIFGTLASGAALVLPGDGVRQDPEALGELMSRHGVERLHIAYTPLKYFAEHGLRVPSLREICVAGEQLVITPALRRLLDAHPKARLFNQYGPTEASVIATSYEVTDRDETTVPIGAPIDGVRVRVVDGHGRPVPVGAVGELCLAGPGLATGYVGDPARTAERFVDGPAEQGERVYRTGDLVRWRADGVLCFLGRLDDQVKIRGHRVEPGEVQWALGRLLGVRDSAVVVHRSDDGEGALVAYVVLEPGAAENLEWSVALREGLRRTLPAYLIPDHWFRVDRLPVNASGKLAMETLPLPGPAKDAAPETPAQKALHTMWCAELQVPSIPLDRSFFDTGGNSLKAVRILARIRERFGYQYPLPEFMHEPTIRAVARILTERTA
ncbi:amino acid adenylation domain-containing protein [Actinoallomurus purpureus]|uniref:non-ribosomal peptide synthetase/type I polyketide synthase n=1 Tax=Actinoallomurus purpureus TaxID=478114 RepID=UPI002092D2AB|nr:non-ribosomal peptide synthetase/type I polyketide synthase [Actinoallomurus purpureus]MCO6007733.1 amino acid adenylation domain-containing protein [Actinoallomurus purpureus]